MNIFRSLGTFLKKGYEIPVASSSRWLLGEPALCRELSHDALLHHSSKKTGLTVDQNP